MSYADGGLAVVIGSSGAIGRALLSELDGDRNFRRVVGFSRAGEVPVDVTSEPSVAAAAAHVYGLGIPVRLVFNATGFLHGDGLMPEKSLRQLDPVHLARAFAINATGPALVMKHFLPLLPREGRAVFATLSAPFARTALNVRTPVEAARDLLALLDRLSLEATGGFFDHRGGALPW